MTKKIFIYSVDQDQYFCGFVGGKADFTDDMLESHGFSKKRLAAEFLKLNSRNFPAGLYEVRTVYIKK
jgi:hypothetical protein